MSQLRTLSPMQTPQPRISQMLPTVKCTSCAVEVPLDELSDHVCAPPSSNATPRYPQREPPSNLYQSRSPPRPVPHGANNRIPTRSPSRYRSPSPTTTYRDPPSIASSSSSSPSSSSRMTETSYNRPPAAPRATPRNPPPPNIRIPPLHSSPSSPASLRNRAPSTAGSSRSARSAPSPIGLPSGPRMSLDEAPPPPRRRPSNDAMTPYHNHNNGSPRSANGEKLPPPQPSAGYRTARPPLDVQAPSPARALPDRHAEPVNMAGVGRRAFAAAATAVIFTQQDSRAMSASPRLDDRRSPSSDRRGSPFTDNRRLNSNNNYLTTAPSSSSGGYSLGAPTPPLSPALSSTSSRSLRSPLSPTPQIPEPPVPVVTHSRTPSNSSSRSNFAKRFGLDTSSPQKEPLSPEESAESRVLPLFEKYKNLAASSVNAIAALGSTFAAKRDSGDSIAKDEERQKQQQQQQEEEEEAQGRPSNESLASETLLAYGRASLASQATSVQAQEKITFPSFGSSSPDKYPGSIMNRSVSSASSYSNSSVGGRIPLRSTPAPDRSLETLVEDSEPPTPNPPATPRRSRTTPAVHHHHHNNNNNKWDKEVEKAKFCVKCDKRIDDGRWVRNEGGGVLCEGCWKNLYLPRCRRCDLPIEKGAISSSDGQLKGKYHKGCFTCTTCQDPFPSKSFYVFENNPYCAYHYHKVNNSLCAAGSCGQPIEGPCAVAHNGDRYHPEHFTCEWRGCRETLDEYWEIDGERYCELHAVRTEDAMRARDGRRGRSRSRGDEGDEGGWEGRTRRSDRKTAQPLSGLSKAQKRVTRYIDIGGMGGPSLDIHRSGDVIGRSRRNVGKTWREEISN